MVTGGEASFQRHYSSKRTIAAKIRAEDSALAMKQRKLGRGTGGFEWTIVLR